MKANKSMVIPTIDGVDHIHVNMGGKTEIGRILAFNYNKRFNVPNAGSFSTATCFVNWMNTGDELARHNPRYKIEGRVSHFREYLLFAKYYQLLKISQVVAAEFEGKEDLCFVDYKTYPSGVKELSAWVAYAPMAKQMVEFIASGEAVGNKEFPWPNGIGEFVKNKIIEIGKVFSPELQDAGTVGATPKPKPKTKQRKAPKVETVQSVETPEETPEETPAP